ncbi:hypothetical protein FB451DRAFT_1385273 [Mycena latifolia]|nr:hypothetical protein FB451DRAFT_1385273 [Mycena latifolia]
MSSPLAPDISVVRGSRASRCQWYLYPIIYGRTRSGSTLVEPPEYDDSQRYAKKALSCHFYWLPSNFSIDATDGSVKLVSSYINNLDPTKNEPLYRLIESVLTSFIPLFERVLSQINGQDQDLYRDVTPGSGRMMVGRTFGTWAGYSNKYCGISVLRIWNKGKPWSLYEDGIRMTDEEAIQCIVKVANIHLTPENPEYKGGGSWHVEGMGNKHIVPSVRNLCEFYYLFGFVPARNLVQYYEEEIISESRLAFRVTTSPPGYHKQDDEICMDILCGMERSATSAGRALAWLNINQHRVAPFSLVDSMKPGHRKILGIFLVDPSITPILSATTVPPQQADWAFATLEDARADPGSAYSRLPPELSNTIYERFPDVFRHPH